MNEAELNQRLEALGIDIASERRIWAIYYIDRLEALHKAFTAIPRTINNCSQGTNARVVVGKAFAQPTALLSNYARIFEFLIAQPLQVALESQRGNRITAFNAFISNRLANDSTYPNAFFEDFPFLSALLTNVVERAKINLQTVAQRIVNDFADINAMFGPNLTKLIKITSSGNDLHKGGQQVLFLTFERTAGGNVKVVYKPGDLEFDCLVLGDTQALRAVDPNFFSTTGGTTQSLYDLVSDHMNFDPQQATTPRLATYKILPKNYGSSLGGKYHTTTTDPIANKDNYNSNGIRSSYGYIEFLTTREDSDPSQTAWYRRLFSKNNTREAYSDFNIPPSKSTEKDSIARDFYNEIGQTIFLALFLGMTDVHRENLLVHNRRPYLIDLENSLYRQVSFDAAGLAQTQLFGGDGAISSYRLENEDAIEINRDAQGEYLTISRFETDKFNPNRLLFNGKAINPAEYLTSIQAGVEAMTAAIKGLSGNGQLNRWKERVRKIIVRNVTFATSDYTRTRNNLLADGRFLRNANWREALNNQQFSATQFEYEDWLTKIRTDAQAELLFLAVYPDYVAPDFSQGDIPIFYAPVNTKVLLDSFGQALTLPAQPITYSSAGQSATLNITRSTINQPLTATNKRTSNDEYLPRVPFDYLETKITEITQLDTTGNPTSSQFTQTIMQAVAKSLGVSLDSFPVNSTITPFTYKTYTS